MNSDEITPRVIELKYDQIEMMVTGDGKSETLIGVADNHAFVSHNMGISWEKIDNVSGYRLWIWPQYNEMHIIDQSGPGSGHGYFLDAEGNVFKEVSGPSDMKMDSLECLSRHPQNPNAILARCTSVGWNDSWDDEITWYYYTKDGGTEWKEMESNKDDNSNIEGPDYKFVDGGAPDLIYKYNEDDNFEYSLNFFSDSPLEFKKLPFMVSKLPYKISENQDFFFRLKDLQELYVSKDGINFEHIKFPAPYQNSTRCKIRGGIYEFEYPFRQSTDERFIGSMFLQKLYPKEGTGLSEFSRDAWLPWTTLFRYDLNSNKMKLLLEYCYDLTVVSAKEGIIIANSVKNPQEYLKNNETPIIKTLITFNDGTDWQPVEGPNGTELSIANFTWRNYFAEAFINDEKPSVPGLLIVQGKEGPIEHYMGNPREIRESGFYSSLSTYITKDSGRSWRKIHHDAMDWTIGGSGDIIILHQTPLKDPILYSLDGGMKWHKFDLGLPELRFATPSYRCESKRFLLKLSGKYSSGPYYCLSFDPEDQP